MGAQPSDRLTAVEGLAVGHWSDPVARTGCTVVLLPQGSVASGEVRGGAPATRDVALLEPSRLVDRADAVVLTGGSAFGLAAADGVMGWLEEQGRGWPTPAGRVPIVPTLGLFDLAVGDPSIRPGPAEGRAACAAAADDHPIGAVGAGTGCTVDSWLGADRARPGGLVAAATTDGQVTVAVLVAVNAYGSVGVGSSEATRAHLAGAGSAPALPAMGNTTIGVVATDATLDKTGCHLLARAAHHGLARAVFPSHTRADGDAFVAVATGTSDCPAQVDRLCVLTASIVERAVLSLGASDLR